MFTGRMSARRALVLIDHLDPGGAFMASVRAAATTSGGGEPDPASPATWRGWTTDRYLATQTLDAIRAVQWTLAAVNSRRRPRKPQPTWHPSHASSRQILPSFAEG